MDGRRALRGLAGPTTAVRGNRIAAVGMLIAVVATLLNPSEGEWGLIVLGIANLVLVIVATIKASDNKIYRYPLNLRLIK